MDSSGSKTEPCGTYPMFGLPRRGGSPSTSSRPPAGASWPRIIRIRVDFPAPFGPRIAVNEPEGMTNVPRAQIGRGP